MAGGKKTTFDGMTHEQMLAWLDAADAGSVQAAADKLAAAAKEIHSIAEELKIRPQWVTWKGQGADSFRDWAGQLANSTLELGDYSQESSKWLGHAAQAIGKAKTSVPRDKGVDANIDAARTAHNDPDSHTILSKNLAVRQQAADEMEKLGQAYSLSETQLDGKKLKPPKFPPPPTDIQDPERKTIDGGGDWGRQGASGGQEATASGASRTAYAGDGHSAGPAASGTSHVSHVAEPVQSVPGAVEPPTRMDVDSVDTLPPPQAPTQATGHAPVNPPASGPATPTPGTLPPAYGSGRTGPFGTRGGGPPLAGRAGAPPVANGSGSTRPGPQSATGRPSTGMRGPTTTPGQSATGRATGTGQGRVPTNGVSGGRPQPATGKPTPRIPRGTVMGGEGNTGNRGAAGGRSQTSQGPVGSRPGPTGGRPGVIGESPRGAGSGRRAAGITGENGGIVGGRPQQQGRASARAFSSGGSGLVRGQGGAGGGSSPEGPNRASQAGRNGAAPNGSRPGERRDEARGGHPDYLAEDEQTWQPDATRNVPPVVDDATRNNER
jgi:uncharacterized protein YukE